LSSHDLPVCVDHHSTTFLDPLSHRQHDLHNSLNQTRNSINIKFEVALLRKNIFKIFNLLHKRILKCLSLGLYKYYTRPWNQVRWAVIQ